MSSHYILYLHYFFEVIVCRVCFVLFGMTNGAVFFVCNLQRSKRIKEDEKEGAGNSILSKTKFVENHSKKQTTTIVDADDKNCLAQLTVVQKLNQSR